MTKTCLDCVNLDIEVKPTPGHVCYECKGKLVAVKANGSNFEEKTCETCKSRRYETMYCARFTEFCEKFSLWEKKR